MATQWNTTQKRTPQEVAALVREISDDLVRYAFCLVSDSVAAEEVALRAMADFVWRNERKALSKAYLYRMVYSRAVDYLRRKRHEVALGDVQEVLSSPDTVEDAAERAYARQVLYRCMQHIPADYRNALYLHVIEGFAVEDVAKIMAKNVKQVYNLLSRAKAALKQRLLEEGFDYEDL